MADCSFEGRVALVTGAGSGLGRQHAIDLARHGAKVMLNGIQRGDTPSKAVAVAEALRAEGLEVDVDTGDMGVERDATAAVEHTVERFGRIDILINNAGHNAGRGAAQDTPTEVLAQTLQVHVFGMFWTMRRALQLMRAQDYGRIVNTGSGAGVFGGPGALSYVTAKAAIMGLTKSAAIDNEDKNIRVNTLSPIAYTQPLHRFFEIDPRFTYEKMSTARITPVLLYLAHEDCPVSGEIFHAAGGKAARLFTAMAKGYASDSLSFQDMFDHHAEIMDSSAPQALRSTREQYPLIP